jgi:hypothetical protein
LDCAEREKLLLEYERATLEAWDASVALAKVAGTTALSNYRLLLEELTRAEAAASNARAVFDRHIIEHRCTRTQLSN